MAKLWPRLCVATNRRLLMVPGFWAGGQSLSLGPGKWDWMKSDLELHRGVKSCADVIAEAVGCWPSSAQTYCTGLTRPFASR